MTTILDELIYDEFRSKLFKIFETRLTFKQQFVIKSRFAIGTSYKTLESIARELNLTTEAIRQTEIKALRKLRIALKAHEAEFLRELKKNNVHNDMYYEYAIKTDPANDKVVCPLCGTLINKLDIDKKYHHYCQKCSHWRYNNMQRIYQRKRYGRRVSWVTERGNKWYEYQ